VSLHAIEKLGQSNEISIVSHDETLDQKLYVCSRDAIKLTYIAMHVLIIFLGGTCGTPHREGDGVKGGKWVGEGEEKGPEWDLP
jgi:hypothetical protein